MKSSFRLLENAIKGGDALGLHIEGLENPTDVVDKKCEMKLYEIDSEKGGNDLLAEFESVIIKGSSKNIYYFDSSKTKRTDSFEWELPKPEYGEDGAGSLLPEPLKYKPSYFDFFFDFGGVRPSSSDFYNVIIRGSSTEIEKYIFEIGFEVIIDGEKVFNSFDMPSYVNCCNILLENCIEVSNFIHDNHNSLLKSRSIGTHFGDHYWYYLHETKQEDFSSDSDFNLSDYNKFKNDRKNLGLQTTSCIDYVLKVLELGHNKSGMDSDWKAILKYLKKGMGQSLAEGLVKHGWVALYYNPDVNNPDVWDDSEDDGSEHIISFKRAKNEKKYGIPQYPPVIPIFDLVINYRPSSKDRNGNALSPTKKTKMDVSQINKLKKIPFGFVLGRGGKHTALLINGKIYQVHYHVWPYRNPNPLNHSDDLFDNSQDFQTKWPWLSGFVLVPKYFWPKSNY